MYLESMHKTLKYCVYEKKKIRRLDHAIFLITTMFDSIYGTYLSKLRKPVADRKSAKVFKGYKSSLLLAKQYKVTKDVEVLKVKNLKSNLSYDIVLIHGEAHECH